MTDKAQNNFIRPNLVIAGVPKCGTSSLFRWLADHPQVCGSKYKETYFLMDADSPYLDKSNPVRRSSETVHEHGLEAYGRFFNHCPPAAKLFVEATMLYMYQRTALEVLAAFEPQPHIIFMLRKPSERIYSSYQFCRNNRANLDRRVSFAEFVARIQDGRSLADVATPAAAYLLENDLKNSRYIEFIRPWLERFEPGHVHVLLLEEMRRDPCAFMIGLCRRLGIDPAFYEKYNYVTYNTTIYISRPWFHRVALRLARLIPGRALRGPLKRLYRRRTLQENEANRRRAIPAEDQATLDALDRYFQPFNEQLAQTLHLDLSAWD